MSVEDLACMLSGLFGRGSYTGKKIELPSKLNTTSCMDVTIDKRIHLLETQHGACDGQPCVSFSSENCVNVI